MSITWITPLLQAMSVLTTLAPSILTPFMVSIVTLVPWTVFALFNFATSAAITFPGTT